MHSKVYLDLFKITLLNSNYVSKRQQFQDAEQFREKFEQCCNIDVNKSDS